MEPDTSEKVRIALIHAPVSVLGPGRRVGIWFQGCHIGCPACISEHTWNPTGGYSLGVEDLCHMVANLTLLHQCDGSTVSGGEPFEQPAALAALLDGLAAAGLEDVLVYSGLTMLTLRRRYPRILEKASAVVDGPFSEGRRTEFSWKGSANQRLHILTLNPGLRRKYVAYRRLRNSRRVLQVVSAPTGTFVLGIPRQEDRDRILHGPDPQMSQL